MRGEGRNHLWRSSPSPLSDSRAMSGTGERASGPCPGGDPSPEDGVDAVTPPLDEGVDAVTPGPNDEVNVSSPVPDDAALVDSPPKLTPAPTSVDTIVEEDENEENRAKMEQNMEDNKENERAVKGRKRERGEGKKCERDGRRRRRDDWGVEGGGRRRRARRPSSSASGSSSSVVSSTYNISQERMKELRDIVDKAAQNQKTFTILGRYPSIRDALKSRGWVQNFDLNKLMSGRPKQLEDNVAVLARLQSADESERLFVSRLLRHTPISFLWATSENIDWNSLCKNTLVSRFPRVYFTTKVGICTYLQQSHWFCEEGVSFTKFPRCYNISSSDDLDIFVRDFRITACLGLLKKLIQEVDEDKDIFSDSGKIPLKAVEFAVKRCWEVVAKEEHEDIDAVTEEQVWDHQWDQFLTHYYQFVHENLKFIDAIPTQIHEMYACAKVALESIAPHWPQLQMDGTNDLWIVKPGAKSRGRGILVFNKLEDIVSRVSTFNNNEVRFVVQKYIERPLLIYNTKFDIRQWFLVTSVYPLTIWMYKESYLRFCSQLFSLTNMHESVHLSNNAIQCKYKNTQKRDRALPDENMWDCYTFKTYLRTIGLSDSWDTVIYSGMRESITGALLAAQEHMEHRRNCFELYGADFMLTEDLVPWLIEINSSPCMSPTTSVTARMCSQCLEDTIKVVIDKRCDKDADTGMFELAYRQQVSNPQPYMGMNLTVKGSRISRAQGTKPNRQTKSQTPDPEEKETGDKERETTSSPAVREAIKRLSDELDGRRDSGSDDSGCSSSGTDSRLNTSSSGVSSSGFSDASSGFSRLSTRSPATYKKHSCCNRRTSSISQAVARYKSRNFEEISRRLRLQSSNLRFKTVHLPQSAELFDWKKRVEQTRADCKRVFMKLSEKKDTKLRKEKVSTVSRSSQSEKLTLPEIRSSPKKELNSVASKKEINNNTIPAQTPRKFNVITPHHISPLIA